MDPVTLYAIATLANGTPRAIQHTVPAERCEDYARYFGRKHPTAIIWCRSELDPPKPYLPDPMDMPGMPAR